MQQQLVPSDEGLATFSTMEGSDASVQSHVVLEATWGLESSRTGLALVNDAVALDVVEPRFVISVDFSALIANEFLFLLVVALFESSFLVLGQVTFQILFVVERARAFRAFVHPVLFLFL